MLAFLRRLTKDLNNMPSRPPGVHDLQLSVYDETTDRDKPMLDMSIAPPGESSSVWTPVRHAVQDLGMLNDNRANGVPDVYIDQGIEEMRLMVIAGMIDPDGTSTKQLIYQAEQRREHRQTLQDIRTLVLAVDIRASLIRDTERHGDEVKGTQRSAQSKLSTPTPLRPRS